MFMSQVGQHHRQLTFKRSGENNILKKPKLQNTNNFIDIIRFKRYDIFV